MVTPKREPQEYGRNMVEYRDPGRYVPTIFLPFSWGSLFGVPSKVPLQYAVSGGFSITYTQSHILSTEGGNISILSVM